VTVRITAAERDALYDELFVRLSGIDGIWLSAQVQDYEAADRLAREFSDDLRLILDDLGWGEGGGEPLELTTPPDVIRRVVTRLQDRAETQRATQEEERAVRQEREEQTQRLMEACRRVLAELGDGGEPASRS
jgi:hypothetical protein